MQESCRSFVQGFYNWYVRKLESGYGLDAALRYKRDAFGPELFRLLQIDRRAASHEDQEYMDWEPFVNGQDWAKRYMVGKVRIDGDRCWANVHGNWQGNKIAKGASPDVMPELMFKDGHWLFVNVHYRHDPQDPVSDNLLSVLKRLHPNPRKTAK